MGNWNRLYAVCKKAERSQSDAIVRALISFIGHHQSHNISYAIKPNSEKWNQQSTLLGYDLRLIYLFIDAIVLTSNSTYMPIELAKNTEACYKISRICV